MTDGQRGERGLHDEDAAPPDHVDEWPTDDEPHHRCAGRDERPPPHRLRSLSGANACRIIAIDAGPVAAPKTAPTTRKAMSDGALHTSAVHAVATAKPLSPRR